MPLEFACPICGAKTVVEDQFCGHSGPCFSCGKTVTVPYNPSASRVSGTEIPNSRRRTKSILPVIIVILSGILAAVVSGVLILSVALPGLRTVRDATQRSSCRNNLQRIGRALQQYHQQYGCYPPAFIPDDTGKPMHSWRVLILPQLNERALYAKYRFDQPWDSAENMQVAYSLPSVYGCPANEDGISAAETSYMVVVGARTPFPPKGETTRMDQFTDPLSETILVVEVTGSNVRWTEPVDLDATQLRLAINPGKASVTALSSEHAGGIHALFADGQVHWLSDGLSLETISAALTKDGRDTFDWAQLQDE